MRPPTPALTYPSTILIHSRPPPRLTTYSLNTSPLRSLQQLSPFVTTKPRALLSSLFPFPGGSNPPPRHLTLTRLLPYSPSLLYRTVTSIDLYPSFLPFTLSSAVTERDKAGYPTRATLKVGYDKLGVEEVWESAVRCDEGAGLVEAWSAEEARGNEESLFAELRTKWNITPVTESRPGTVANAEGENGGRAPNDTGSLSSVASSATPSSKVDLTITLQFRSPFYDAMFSQVEGKVAGAVIGAFETRARELESAERGQKRP